MFASKPKKLKKKLTQRNNTNTEIKVSMFPLRNLNSDIKRRESIWRQQKHVDKSISA